MALSYTVKATTEDGKPFVLMYLDDNDALQSVTSLMTADYICEIHVFIRQDDDGADRPVRLLRVGIGHHAEDKTPGKGGRDLYSERRSVTGIPPGSSGAVNTSGAH